MKNYFCESCDLVFESQIIEKNEYFDPIYGPCWNYTAACPQCGSKSFEKVEKKNVRKDNTASPAYPQNFCSQNSCCGCG